MDFWSLLLKLFGGGVSIPSPRSSLLNSVFSDLLKPTTPDLITQTYFDVLSVFFWLALPLFIVEFVYRAYRALNTTSPGEEMSAFARSSAWLTIAVPLLPGFVLFVKAFFDAFGQFVLLTMAGTQDPADVVRRVQALTGNPGFDFFLAPVQGLFLFVFYLELFIIVAMVFATSILLLIGVSLRWMGDFGDTVYKFCVRFSIYGVALNFILLLVFGIDFGVQSAAFPKDRNAQAFLNTGTIVICVFLVPMLLKSLKGQFKAVVTAAGSGYDSLRNRGTDNGGPSNDSRGREGQERNSNRARRSREEQNATGTGSNGRSSESEPASQSKKSSGSKTARDENPRNNERSDELTERSASSTAERSRPRRRSSEPVRERERTATRDSARQDRVPGSSTTEQSAVREAPRRQRRSEPDELTRTQQREHSWSDNTGNPKPADNRSRRR